MNGPRFCEGAELGQLTKMAKEIFHNISSSRNFEGVGIHFPLHGGLAGHPSVVSEQLLVQYLLHIFIYIYI